MRETWNGRYSITSMTYSDDLMFEYDVVDLIENRECSVVLFPSNRLTTNVLNSVCHNIPKLPLFNLEDFVTVYSVEKLRDIDGVHMEVEDMILVCEKFERISEYDDALAEHMGCYINWFSSMGIGFKYDSGFIYDCSGKIKHGNLIIQELYYNNAIAEKNGKALINSADKGVFLDYDTNLISKVLSTQANVSIISEEKFDSFKFLKDVYSCSLFANSKSYYVENLKMSDIKEGGGVYFTPNIFDREVLNVKDVKVVTTVREVGEIISLDRISDDCYAQNLRILTDNEITENEIAEFMKLQDKSLDRLVRYSSWVKENKCEFCADTFKEFKSKKLNLLNLKNQEIYELKKTVTLNRGLLNLDIDENNFTYINNYFGKSNVFNAEAIDAVKNFIVDELILVNALRSDVDISGEDKYTLAIGLLYEKLPYFLCSLLDSPTVSTACKRKIIREQSKQISEDGMLQYVLDTDDRLSLMVYASNIKLQNSMLKDIYSFYTMDSGKGSEDAHPAIGMLRNISDCIIKDDIELADNYINSNKDILKANTFFTNYYNYYKSLLQYKKTKNGAEFYAYISKFDKTSYTRLEGEFFLNMNNQVKMQELLTDTSRYESLNLMVCESYCKLLLRELNVSKLKEVVDEHPVGWCAELVKFLTSESIAYYVVDMNKSNSNYYKNRNWGIYYMSYVILTGLLEFNEINKDFIYRLGDHQVYHDILECSRNVSDLDCLSKYKTIPDDCVYFLMLLMLRVFKVGKPEDTNKLLTFIKKWDLELMNPGIVGLAEEMLNGDKYSLFKEYVNYYERGLFFIRDILHSKLISLDSNFENVLTSDSEESLFELDDDDGFNMTKQVELSPIDIRKTIYRKDLDMQDTLLSLNLSKILEFISQITLSTSVVLYNIKTDMVLDYFNNNNLASEHASSVTIDGFRFPDTRLVLRTVIPKSNITEESLKSTKQLIPVIDHLLDFRMFKNAASRDRLTNLLTRRFFEVEFINTCAKAIEFSLMITDIDLFKNINDTYGYLTGDNVIHGIASLAINEIEKTGSGVVGRYGGEEFIYIVYKDGLKTAEKLRQAVEQSDFTDGRKRVTVSCGISTYPLDSKDYNELIEYANIALHQCKTSGRNKCLKYFKGMGNDDVSAGKYSGILSGSSRDYQVITTMLDLIEDMHSEEKSPQEKESIFKDLLLSQFNLSAVCVDGTYYYQQECGVNLGKYDLSSVKYDTAYIDWKPTSVAGKDKLSVAAVKSDKHTVVAFRFVSSTKISSDEYNLIRKLAQIYDLNRAE